MNKRVWLGLSAGTVVASLAGAGFLVVQHGDGDTQVVAGENDTAPGSAANGPEQTPRPPEIPTVIPLPADERNRTESASAEFGGFTIPAPADTGQPAGGRSDQDSFTTPVQLALGPPQTSDEYTPFDEPAASGPGAFEPPAGSGQYAAVSDDQPSPAADQLLDPPTTEPTLGAAASINDESGVLPPVANHELSLPELPPMATDAQAGESEFPSGATELPPENLSPQPPPQEPPIQEPPVSAMVIDAPVAEAPMVTQPETPAPPPAFSFAPEASSAPAILSQQTEFPAAIPPASAIVAAALTADTPGPSQLEGEQAPMVVLQRTAPREIQVGKTAAFQTTVQNVGQVTAHNVVVTDRVPRGTQFVDATPQYTLAADGSIAWQLGNIEPGEEITIAMDIMPQSEGEIGSVAQVAFQAQASVRTICTKPELQVNHTGPEQVLIGREVVFEITISNPGSGATTGVVLEEDVPLGFTHPAGPELESAVGTLAPGETIQRELIMNAEEAGIVANIVRVHGDGGLVAEHRLQVEIVAPQLAIAVAGPKLRYLDRDVVYEIAIANPGTASATEVELVTYLPPGLQYVAADSQGRYDRESHAVYWSLAELPPNQQGVVELTARAIESGEQKLVVDGTADLDLHHQREHTTIVEGVTEVRFTVSDLHGPIEVGGETTYEVRVVNNGSKAATNVRIGAALPPGVTPVDGDGPTRVVVEGQTMLMEPLAQLAPDSEEVYTLRVQERKQGDHIVRVQLACDEVPTPVTKEERTRVYADE